MAGLPPRQAEVLLFIVAHRAEHGYSPSLTEMSEHFGIYPNAVQQLVNRLVRKGRLARTPGVARSLVPA